MTLSSLLQEISTSQYQLYVDLDGVIVDFDSAYQKYTGLSPDEMDSQLQKQYGEKKSKEIFWDKVDPVGTKFWSKMPWMRDGHQLWDFIKSYKPILLSSPSRSKTSVEGKKEWVNKNLPGVKLILRQADNKQEFANPKCILIDDRKDTCNQWKSHNGAIAIHHKNTEDTIRQLKKLGFGKDNIQEIQVKSGRISPEMVYNLFYNISLPDQLTVEKYWNTQFFKDFQNSDYNYGYKKFLSSPKIKNKLPLYYKELSQFPIKTTEI